jgi:hypothetical protein
MSNRIEASDAGGVTRFTKRLFASDPGGVVRLIIRGFVSDPGGVTRFIYSGQVSATATPSTESASGFAPTFLTTGTTTTTATGGVPGYTFAWTWQSGGTGITITSPSTASTAFSASLSPGDNLTGVAQCTVTDTVGHTGIATCSVHLRSTN